MSQEDEVRKLAEEAVRRGKLIEIGWLSLRRLIISPNAPEMQIKEMRWAFFAGAQHLYASIMTIIEPEEEPTDAELAKMNAIYKELEIFRQEIKAATSQRSKPEMN